MKKTLPWILVVLFLVWIASDARAPKPKDGFAIADFGRLPVLLNGRVQPFDSVGKNALLSMSGKSSVRTGSGRMNSSEWLLEAMTKPEQADTRKIFRAQHPDLESMLGGQAARLEYYSFNHLTNYLEQIETRARELAKSEAGNKEAPKLRTPFQKDLMHLYDSMILNHRIKNSLQPEGAADFGRELQIFQERIPAGLAALQASEAGEEHSQEDLQAIAAFFRRYQTMARFAYPLIVPPQQGEPREAWSNVGNNLMEAMRSNEIHPAIPKLATIATAYAQGKSTEFNAAVTDYRQWLETNGLQKELKKARQEFFFNQLGPFYKAMVIYVAALLLGSIYWINLGDWVRRAAFALLGLAFVIHTVGLLFRMFLEGRPPVTNLYSSAVFVGWGAAVLSMILEKIYRNGIGIVVAAVAGFVTLIIAHHLSLSGDTMEMLQAVLDTNIWLATHVVIITIGYSSMFVAGLLGIIYILRGVLTRSLSADTAKSLSRMTYGILCFATLFSFVGTILGGIWADQSWGRFWGWDPKENGALLIVIWCAVALHARWGGMIRERGLMVMAIAGNIITSLSWFGVNMLGIGLHSYGFMDKAAFWLITFIVSQLLIMGLGLLPFRFWASFRSRMEPPNDPPAPGTPKPATV